MQPHFVLAIPLVQSSRVLTASGATGAPGYAVSREKEIPMTSAAPVSSVLPDPATPFGAQVARRLREEMVIWVTAEAEDGTPQPNPVWFLWDGASFLIYCQRGAKRLEHIRRNPRVALNFN